MYIGLIYIYISIRSFLVCDADFMFPCNYVYDQTYHPPINIDPAKQEVGRLCSVKIGYFQGHLGEGWGGCICSIAYIHIKLYNIYRYKYIHNVLYIPIHMGHYIQYIYICKTIIYVGTMHEQFGQESGSRRSRPEVPLSEEQRQRGSAAVSGPWRQKMGETPQ